MLDFGKFIFLENDHASMGDALYIILDIFFYVVWVISIGIIYYVF